MLSRGASGLKGVCQFVFFLLCFPSPSVATHAYAGAAGATASAQDTNSPWCILPTRSLMRSCGRSRRTIDLIVGAWHHWSAESMAGEIFHLLVQRARSGFLPMPGGPNGSTFHVHGRLIDHEQEKVANCFPITHTSFSRFAWLSGCLAANDQIDPAEKKNIQGSLGA